MEKDRFEHLLENLQALIEIGKNIKEDLDEEKEEDEFLKSLHDDYNDFFTWAFGLSPNESDNKKKYLKANLKMRWEKLHPEHILPRVLQSEYVLNPALNTVCLFMDAYPIFLEERET